MAPSNQQTSRGKNFNSDELKQLCQSYLHITQCSKTGANQTSTKYWDRVAVHYNANKSSKDETRTAKSLETKGSDVWRDVFKFKGCYGSVKDLRLSGDSAEDTMDKAKELYRQKIIQKDEAGNPKGRPKDFQYMECYELLKDDPHMGQPADPSNVKGNKNGKKRTHEDVEQSAADVGGKGSPGGESDSPDGLATTRIDLSFRPMGTKQAKKLERQERHQDSTYRVASDSQKKMAETASERLKVVEFQNLMLILSGPGFEDPRSQALMQAAKEAEVKRLTLRMNLNSTEPITVSSGSAPRPTAGSAATDAGIRPHEAEMDSAAVEETLLPGFHIPNEIPPRAPTAIRSSLPSVAVAEVQN